MRHHCPRGVLLTVKGPGSSAHNLINVSIARARGKLVIAAGIATSCSTMTRARGSCLSAEGVRLAADYNPNANPSLRGSAPP